MNKTAIKNFAIWARNKLISDIQFRAQLLGVLPDRICEPLPQSDGQTQFFDIGTKDYVIVKGGDVSRRAAFVEALRAKAARTDYATAYKTIIEKVAYTWFNRLIAIRFMEVNDYLPGRVRVLSSTLEGKAEPDLVSNPFEGGLTFTEQERDTILRFKDKNRLDELFRMLFIMECQSLSEILPGLFEKKEESLQPRDYHALLLNVNFTDRNGLVWHLTHDIPERDFRVRTREDDLRQAAEGIPEEEMPAGQVEIIGWLYQYYNTDAFNALFDGDKATGKIERHELPCATQLFTPDWIVRYMVQNSLGRLWVEGHLDAKERLMPEYNADGSVCVQEGRWNYYLEEAPQEQQVETQLQAIREEYARLRPEDIKAIDPCCGSGHIAVYLFDVLMQIYETQGWTKREAAQSIVEHNLYALDIDDRAAQLAYFAVMMKARQYDRRFFTREIQPHVYSIPEWDEDTGKWSDELINLCEIMREGKELGSILVIPEMNWEALREEVSKMHKEGQLSIDTVSEETQKKLYRIIEAGEDLSRQYHVLVTNPPYLNANRMNQNLVRYIDQHYKVAKQDLYSVMYSAQAKQRIRKDGIIAFITPTSWMHSSKFEKFRKDILESSRVLSLVDCGTELFDGKVGHLFITAWLTRKRPRYGVSSYVDLTEYCYSRRNEKENQFFSCQNRGYFQQDLFNSLPGWPLAYDVKQRTLEFFSLGKTMDDHGASRQGLTTSDNNRFIRLWFEVNSYCIDFRCSSVSEALERGSKWFPFLKGGDFQRWYQREEFVVNYKNDGKEIKDLVMKKYPYLNNPGFVVKNTEWYFRQGITWNDVGGDRFNARLSPIGFIFADAGPTFFPNNPAIIWVYLAFMNSQVFQSFANVICQGLHYSTGQIPKIPCIDVPQSDIAGIQELAKSSYNLVGQWYNSYETSWDFMSNPLIEVISRGGTFFERGNIDLAECWLLWKGECEERFQQLKSNEEELNRIFIDIYGLQDELTPEVEDKDVTVRRADLGRDIRSLISYAVGCMFGRYSLDRPGLQFAGGDWKEWLLSQQSTVNRQQTDSAASPQLTKAVDCRLSTVDFSPVSDNCLPITDEDYGLKDDVVNRFVDFIRTVYGEAALETNLDFIAHALGNRGDTSRDVIRNYFLNDFFGDHCRTYSVTGSGKRPIYWLFDSGKANGFKALVYMHRWNADTVGNLRVEYLHRMQRVYEKEIERMQDTIDNARDSREVARATKRREKLVKQLKEARDYDAKIAHVALSRVEIDLDDGVKVNYEKVQKGPDGKSLGILAKI